MPDGRIRNPHRLIHTDFFGDTVNRAQRADNVVAVNSHHMVTGHGVAVYAQGCGIVLFFIGGNNDRTVHDNGIGVGAVFAVFIRIASVSVGRHGNAHHIVGTVKTGLIIIQNILQISFDLRSVSHAFGILPHQQGFLVQQFHMHIDMMNFVIRQGFHFDKSVKAQIARHNIIDFGFRFIRIFI